jgi:predicted amidohydrolase
VQNNRSDYVRVASIQFPSRLGEREYNITGLSRLCEEAAQKGAKIIVLPETAITGYLSQDLKTNWKLPDRIISISFPDSIDPTNYAETYPGTSTDYFSALAKQLGVYITVPFLEIDRSTHSYPSFYNTVCLASPKGTIVAHYRKNNPWPHPEKSWATAGKDLGIYDTEYGRVGLAICFDIHTILSRYAKEKIWALLYPIAWVGSVSEWFRNELPQKLSKAKVPFNIIGANWSVDTPQDWHGYGYSTIYGSNGLILAASGNLTGTDIIYAEIPTQNRLIPQPEMNYNYYTTDF